MLDREFGTLLLPESAAASDTKTVCKVHCPALGLMPVIAVIALSAENLPAIDWSLDSQCQCNSPLLPGLSAHAAVLQQICCASFLAIKYSRRLTRLRNTRAQSHQHGLLRSPLQHLRRQLQHLPFPGARRAPGSSLVQQWHRGQTIYRRGRRHW